ncbi:hypothetical protein PNBC_09630 [Paenibacillus crassostreae]|uniref:Uncharacterized protein n=2 Tax=Paenibacillus crassostreae TaxID=1763538 RepID=A0A162RRY4_9BACL|nr:hypothetical protein LPB68_04330 [Paenibacillus crassostreae]OAB74327.1 hypothetical protein PNBC_09630 [Paenibacillus crassostreae]
MSIYPSIETEEDIRIIKEYTLLPILLDMLARDIDNLTVYKDQVIYNYVIYHLRDVEQSIYPVLHNLKHRMKQRQITILNTDMNRLGIEVEYKVRGYIHHFNMLRSLVRAELITMLKNLHGGG